MSSTTRRILPFLENPQQLGFAVRLGHRITDQVEEDGALFRFLKETGILSCTAPVKELLLLWAE